MNNNYNNTMNNNDNNNDNSHSNSSVAAATIMRTPARKLEPGTLSALYKLAARNLRESHGVPSMTALKLEKTVVLLRLAPRRVVVLGLAPRRLLKYGSSPLVLAGEGSGKGEEELRETNTGEQMDTSDDDRTNNNSSSSSSEEEKGVSDDSDSMHDDNSNNSIDDHGEAKDDVEILEADGNGKARRPFHAALVAGGINLRPSETGPLLRALGVRPHRLVRLGLVKREALRAMLGKREGDPGQRQHLRAGRPRKGGMGRPHGPRRGSPHDHGGRPMHGPLRPIDGDSGYDTMHLAEESDRMSAPLRPHGGSGHHGPRHQGGRRQGPPHGPGHHSMSIVRHGRGPPGGGKHEHAHPHPHGHGHSEGEGEGEEGKRLHGGARGPGQRGPRRRHGGGGMVRSNGRPLGPFGGLFRERGASGGPPGVMAHPHHGSHSQGEGMKQRGDRHGGTGSCGGGGGGGHRQHGRMAHLARFNRRHQPQLETN